jgi:gliding motility-associated-like protein
VTSENELCHKANGSAMVVALAGAGNYTYLWNTGAVTALDSGLTEGNYSVTVSDGYCFVSATVAVNETPGPTADFLMHPEVLTLFDKYVTASFSDFSSGNIVDWFWNYGTDTIIESGSEGTHSFFNTGNYPVMHIIIDINGCVDTVIKTITVRDYYTIYIPNCFTPDNDGLNDYFFPLGITWDVQEFEMDIFDRWGNIVYQSFDSGSAGWNGTFKNKGSKDEAVVGVYIYLIRVKEAYSSDVHEYRGSVTLMR